MKKSYNSGLSTTATFRPIPSVKAATLAKVIITGYKVIITGYIGIRAAILNLVIVAIERKQKD